jgi:hypothetical protein
MSDALPRGPVAPPPRRATLSFGVVALCALDVLLSPFFFMLGGFAGGFTMTKLSVDMLLLLGAVLAFICPVVAVGAGLLRMPHRFVLGVALLPVLALAAAVALVKGLGVG